MDFKLVEDKWQKYWKNHPEIYAAKNPSTSSGQLKPKKYILVEFPYPSGSGLHVGHAFSYTGGDVYARFKRMQGNNVLFPMGWDAFGLPTENYAIKMKKKPQDVTKENTDKFRNEMNRLAFSFDWSKEVNTTDPAYYKWTQWIFIQLFKKGLAYKKEMPINWCPSCKIGLANEEVVDGKCERCGAEVSRRNISQWVVKITDYADKLIDGLEKTDFIEKVKQSQINWIGKSEGAKVRFEIVDDRLSIKHLEVFTTRPDTLFGATFMVIAPEHALVSEIVGDRSSIVEKNIVQKIKDYVKDARKKSEMERTELNKEKTGVFSGLYAVNPVNNKEIPIWISDFVLASYGTGAIMSVPAHDDRDEAFAKKFGLEIKRVYDENKKAINSEFLNGLEIKEAFEKMVKWLEEKGIGEKTASYHLRDWIFSRQHYWGEPIPMIFCEKCAKNQNNDLRNKIYEYSKKNNIDNKILENNPGWYPVEDKTLPIVLPEVKAYEPTDDGKSPLSKIESFTKCKCPVCGEDAQRETDTMPNWAGSDWYFLGYILADKINKGKVAFAKATADRSDTVNDVFSDSQKELKYWSPVDIYIGGDEHNVLHLLYSRFIYKFLWELGVLPKEISEPYYKRISHGVILGPDNQRMSKSRGNVIIPETVADKYGVDVTRMYLMFMGPFDSTMAWNEKTLMGVKRFLDRYEKFIDQTICQSNDQTVSSNEVGMIINKTIKGVTEDLGAFKYNTAIAKMMEMINSLSVVQSISLSVGDIKKITKLLAPLAPYTTEELYSRFDDGSIHSTDWPEVEEKYLVDKEIKVMVAINGKVRDQLIINNEELKIDNKEEIIKRAKELEQIKKWIGDKKILNEIYVTGKMVNLVLQ